MGTDQRFSLKWNNYQAHLVTAFESLLGDKDFVDVTLGTEGRKLPAHKMLLSACSPYFRELLKDNPCQHPIIILRDVRYEDLYSLLQFMYNGEVNVAQEQLNSFLKAAEALKIRGLTDNEDNESNKSSSRGGGMGGSSTRTLSPSLLPTPPSAPAARKKRPAPEPITPLTPATPPSKRPHQTPHPPAPASRVNNISTPHSNSEPVKQEVIDLGEDNIEMEGEAEEGTEYTVEEGDGGGGTVAHYEGGGYRDEDEGGLMVPEDENIEDSLHHEQGGGQAWFSPEDQKTEFVCPICGKVFQHDTTLSSHLKVHTGETRCPICGKILSRKADVRRHARRVHRVMLE